MVGRLAAAPRPRILRLVRPARSPSIAAASAFPTLSRSTQLPTLEEWMHDVGAVMDVCGIERTAAGREGFRRCDGPALRGLAPGPRLLARPREQLRTPHRRRRLPDRHANPPTTSTASASSTRPRKAPADSRAASSTTRPPRGGTATCASARGRAPPSRCVECCTRSTCVRSCPRCVRRRSSCTAATTDGSTSRTLATSPSTSTARVSSSCPVRPTLLFAGRSDRPRCRDRGVPHRFASGRRLRQRARHGPVHRPGRFDLRAGHGRRSRRGRT